MRKFILMGMICAALPTLRVGAQQISELDDVEFFHVSQEVQPPALAQNQPPQSSPSDRRIDPTLAAADTALRSTAARRRLARTPEMFGDFFGPQIVIVGEGGMLATQSPGPGGGVTKVADSNKATIGCRDYMFYNHFHNASAAELGSIFGPLDANRSHIDRFTFGFERPLGVSQWSAELRIPIFVDLDQSVGGVPAISAGEFGNVAAILKRELVATDVAVLSSGLGVSLPTGGDVHGDDGVAIWRVRNDAVHLLPFIAVQRQFETFFLHGFVQMDIDVNGNAASVDDGFDSAVVNNQTLFFIDLGVGRWFYRNAEATRLRGVAGLFEIHYETALQDADVVTLSGIGADVTIGNTTNRFDVVNLTAAIQADLGQRSSMRIGASAPVTQGDDRFFDAEVALQLIIRCCDQ